MKQFSKSKAVFESIKQGLEEALAFARGEGDPTQYRVHIPLELDLRAIRKKTGLTQEAFAVRFGFNLARLRDLEQKHTRPDSAIRAYLIAIQKNLKP